MDATPRGFAGRAVEQKRWRATVSLSISGILPIGPEPLISIDTISSSSTGTAQDSAEVVSL